MLFKSPPPTHTHKRILLRTFISTLDGMSSLRSQLKNNTSPKPKSHRNQKSPRMRAKRVILCYLKDPLSLWPRRKGPQRGEAPPNFELGVLVIILPVGVWSPADTPVPFRWTRLRVQLGDPKSERTNSALSVPVWTAALLTSCSRPLPSTAHENGPHACWAAWCDG